MNEKEHKHFWSEVKFIRRQGLPDAIKFRCFECDSVKIVGSEEYETRLNKSPTITIEETIVMAKYFVVSYGYESLALLEEIPETEDLTEFERFLLRTEIQRLLDELDERYEMKTVNATFEATMNNVQERKRFAVEGGV